MFTWGQASEGSRSRAVRRAVIGHIQADWGREPGQACATCLLLCPTRVPLLSGRRSHLFSAEEGKRYGCGL